MKKVCLLVGHWQIESLTGDSLRSWRSVTDLRKSTGASGERDWHWNEWMPRLRDKLLANGNFHVYIASGIYDPNVYNQDFDLWIAGHYDGGGTGERCMISSPSREQNNPGPYLNSGAFSESERFCSIWKATYPDMVGVPNRDDMITAGMVDYYAFDYPLMDTPCVIIEHFNWTSARGGELKNNPDIVANSDYQAILKFFNLDQPSVPSDKYSIVYKGQTLATYDTNPQDKITELDSKLASTTQTLAEVQAVLGTCQTNLTQQEKDNADLVTQLNEVKRVRDDLQSENNSLKAKVTALDAAIADWIIKYNNLKTACQDTNVLKKFTKTQLLRYIVLGHI